MLDNATEQPLHVSSEYLPHPRIEVADSQLEELKQLLNRHGIPYWVDEHSISFNDGPFTTIVHFYRGTDVKVVQKILDSVD